MTPQSFRGYVSLTKLFSHYLSTLQHHMHIHHRRDYDEQKEVVLVYALSPVLPIKVRNVLYTKVSHRLR